MSDSNVFGAEAEPDRYQLVQELASGGMATVFLARTRAPEEATRVVAVKRIHRHLARDKAFVEMFFDEARIAARIDHANVCEVFDYGRVGGTFFIAMEYILGETLTELLHVSAKDRELRQSRRWQLYMASIVAEACDGLHAVHELCDDQGRPMHVVHRDVSPYNIFVTYDGGVKVVDFGIAFAEEKVHHTKTGTIKGNLGYMAPELLSGDGRNVDRRVDVWGLGVCLWELLFGGLLFRARGEAATVLNVMQRPVPSLQGSSQVPPELDAIVARALERDRGRRYPTAEEMGRDLRRWIASTRQRVDAQQVGEFMQMRFAPQYARKLDALDQALIAPGTVPLEQLVEDQVTNVLPLRAPSGPRSEWTDLIRSSLPEETAPPVPVGAAMPVPVAPVTTPPAPAPRRRRWLPFSVAFAGAALALGGTGVALWQGQRQPAAPAVAVATATPASGSVEAPASPVATPPVATPPVVTPPAETQPGETRPVEHPAARPSVEDAPGEEPPRTSPPEEPADDRPGRSEKRRRKSTRHEARRHGDKERRQAGSTAEEEEDDAEESRPSEVAEPKPPAVPEPRPPVESSPPPARPPKPSGPLVAAMKIHSLSVQGSLVNSMVSRGIDRVSSSLRQCYRDAAVAAGRNARGSVHVTLSISETGQVDRATATGGPLPGIDECVKQAVMKIRTVNAPDVGGASAKFDVSFTPRGE